MHQIKERFKRNTVFGQQFSQYSKISKYSIKQQSMTFIRNSMIVEDSARNAVKRLKSYMLSFTGCLEQSGQVKTIFKAINNLSVNCLQRKTATRPWGHCCFACKQARVKTVAFYHFRTLNVSSQLSNQKLQKHQIETYRSRFLNKKTCFLIVVLCAAMTRRDQKKLKS